MNNIVRIIIEAVSIVVSCLLLIWLTTLTNNATEVNSNALSRGDLTTAELTQSNDFIDYLEEEECVTDSCADWTECATSGHSHVRYLRKEIKGSEVLRLITKYNEIVEGTVLVRTDKITRNYNKLYKFVKNMPNNLDYISPSAIFVAKVVLKDNKPYTMYFTQKGKMFYKDTTGKEKDIEELLFHQSGHSSSNFLMFTEDAEYVFPNNTGINKIKIYACASGLGTKAGEALAGEVVKASVYKLASFSNCKLKIEINYKGNTVIKFYDSFGMLKHTYILQTGGFDPTGSIEEEQAKDVFGAFTCGKDGENGSDGYCYTVTSDYYGTNVVAEELLWKGGKGGQGGLYGFGGGGGNAGYEVKRENGVVSFNSIPPMGGSSGIVGYTYADGEEDNTINTKLLLPAIVGYGGAINDYYSIITVAHGVEEKCYLDNSITVTERTRGGNGSLYFGGHGGTAAGFSASNKEAPTFLGETEGQSVVLFNGAGGGGGGYGAGGGEAGACDYNNNRSNENGEPSGGMVYLQFMKEGD